MRIDPRNSMESARFQYQIKCRKQKIRQKKAVHAGRGQHKKVSCRNGILRRGGDHRWKIELSIL